MDFSVYSTCVAIDRSGVHGWKRAFMNWMDRLFFSIPFMTEFLNQGMSKNLGILAAWHFISRIELEGDYLEFGVFRGETFRNAILGARQGFRGTIEGQYSGRFFAFDSFEGLPEVDSMKEKGNIYAKGEFSSSLATFYRSLGGLDRKYPVKTIQGWLDQTLTPELAKEIKLEKIAFANVDVDLYESTVPVLRFITPYLQTGSILYFDDWYSIKGDMYAGEPRACSEWLNRHPEIRLIEYRQVGITGKMFIVNRTS